MLGKLYQVFACLFVGLTLFLKTDVGYEAQQVVAVLFDDAAGFFVVGGQQYFWTSPHAQHFIQFIGAHIVDDASRLLHKGFIEEWQIARVVHR